MFLNRKRKIFHFFVSGFTDLSSSSSSGLHHSLSPFPCISSKLPTYTRYPLYIYLSAQPLLFHFMYVIAMESKQPGYYISLPLSHLLFIRFPCFLFVACSYFLVYDRTETAAVRFCSKYLIPSSLPSSFIPSPAHIIVNQ